MKTLFIFNPNSGRGSSLKKQAHAFATAQGHLIRVTTHRGHARELAREAGELGCELVVSVGGDGTMNEIASALTGTPMVLGLVPAGSGNGLARHLGIHGSPAHIFQTLQTGRVRVIDTGLADGHPFFTVAGLGFESLVSARFGTADGRGFAGYLRSAARQLAVYPSDEYSIASESGTRSLTAFTIAIANANQYGNGARIAPAARLDDGRLDLVAIPKVGWGNGAALLARLFHGSLLRLPDVHHEQVSRVLITRREPGLLHTDGEIHSAGAAVEFSVRPASLRVLVPNPINP